MASSDVRVAAVRVLQQLSGGGSLTQLLPPAQDQVAPADRALLQALCYGAVRWSGQLSGIVDALLPKPLKKKDQDVYRLLQLGVFQLLHTRVAPHAAVDKTVAATRPLGKPWAKGLVNGVLRNFLRSRDSLLTELSEPAVLSHPLWLIAALKKDWPAHWQQIIDENNKQAPMTLRVNLRLITREDYISRLEQAGMQAIPVTGSNSAITLNKAVQVTQLPGFSDGLVSVQDAAAQLAAPLLGTEPGRRLLDACAAPGGKTAHACECVDWQHVVALDADADRIQRVHETVQRLHIQQSVQIVCADASAVGEWWDEQLFDAILLDAPCSGTGVIRRHPDIKWSRRATDIDALVQTQQAMLDALWSTLMPAGRMLYATCSILKRENESQITHFLQRHANARVVPIDLPAGNECVNGGVQILPGDNQMDGFYFALLEKYRESSSNE